MNIEAVDLSESALQGIGRLVTPKPWSTIPAGTDFLYSDTMSDLGLGGVLSSGFLLCAPRPMILNRMERHFNTKEMIVALEGDAIVCLAPPQEPSGGKLLGKRAVKVLAGEAFILDIGAWHWIPYPCGASPGKFLIVFKSMTGADDLHFCDFDEASLILA
jgi:hypothetical protein